MTKTTDLTELASPADSDYLMIVDRSDTSMDASGTNKKIQVSNLPAGAGGAGGASVPITTITDPAGGVFTFNPSAGYQDIVIMGELRSAGAGTSTPLRLYLNGDTLDTNYYYQRDYGQGGTGGNQDGAVPAAGVVPGAGSPASAYGYFRVVIPNYAGANLKGAFTEFGSRIDAAVSSAGHQHISHDTLTGAVTQVDIQTSGGDNLLGSLTMYGVSNAPGGVPGGELQALRVDEDGTVKFQSGGTWGVVKSGTGLYTITFPTAAPDADSQSVVASQSVDGTSAAAFIINVREVTATGCVVLTTTDDGTATDREFSLQRVIG